MLGLVKQNHGALGVIDGRVKERRIERDRPERKVRRGVCVVVSKVGVPPVIGRAIVRKMTKHDDFSREPTVFQSNDGLDDAQVFVGIDGLGRQQQRPGPDEDRQERDSDDPHEPACDAVRRCSVIRRRLAWSALVTERHATATAGIIRREVDEAALGALAVAHSRAWGSPGRVTCAGQSGTPAVHAVSEREREYYERESIL